VTLNIDATRKNGADSSPANDAGVGGTASPGPDPNDRARSALETDVVEELSSWNPREFVAAFRRWHQGAISLAHLNVLTLLEAEGPMSMSHLAEALDVSVASATGIIDRMEARDLVSRRHDTTDRRVVLVEPAAAAAALFGGIDARRRQGLEHLLARLSDDELRALLQGHRALRAARAAFKAEHEAQASAAALPPRQPEAAR
jgi:DNA-binding MarR family transcriptional regulator